MSQITLLDSTLSDGGNANNYQFDELATKIIHGSIGAGSKFIEAGILACTEYSPDNTRFNTITQANTLIAPKLNSVLYGVRIETEAFSLVERMPDYDSDGIDFIRVVFEKRDLLQAYECCKLITEKGYKIAVHPRCTAQYTGEELDTCLRLFSHLAPLIFYIDDNYGAFSALTLTEYLQRFSTIIPNTGIGFQGRNYLNGQTQLLQAISQFDMPCEIIVNATAGGLERFNFSFRCEDVAQFVCKQQSKAYDVGRYIEIADWLSAPIRTACCLPKIGRLFQTASVNCNPLWAFYSVQPPYCLSDEEFKLFITQLPEEKKWEVTKDVYKESVQEWIRPFWDKKLAVIVPTANRPKSIAYYLQMVGNAHEFLGVDLIFYDSSSDDKTKQVIDDFTKGECRHIIYERYTGGFDGITIDEKGVSAYDVYSRRYEYVWMTRDSWVIDIYAIHSKLHELISEKFDAVVLYSPGEDNKGIGYKEYTDCAELFRDSCCHMSILGATVFSSAFMKRVVQCQPLGPQNYGMWQPIAMLHQWAEDSVRAVNYTTHYYFRSIYSSDISFYNKSGNALWQWAENWYSLISALPSVYDIYKPQVFEFRIAGFCALGFVESLIMRTTGSMTWKKVKHNEKYMEYVAKQPMMAYYILCLIPKCICRATLNPNNLVGKLLVEIKKIYCTLKKLYTLPDVLPERYDLSVFDVKQKTNDIVFAKNELCIIIPTHGPVEVLRDNLAWMCKQYAQYGMDVIVFDSSATDDVKMLVADEYVPQYANLRYERYDGEMEPRSIDKKIVAAYERFSGEYRYLWLMRDRTLVDMNACAFRIWEAMEQGMDLIVLSEKEDASNSNGCETYDDAAKLFRDACQSFFRLGSVIVSGDMIRGVILEQPISQQNIGLWQLAALFHYFTEHPFSAVRISAKAFYFHPSDLLGNFYWKQDTLWQWVERVYTVFYYLPEIYDDERTAVLRELDGTYGFVHPKALLHAKLTSKLRLIDVHKHGKLVAHVSGTSYPQLVKLALMPKWLAKLMAAQPQYHVWRNLMNNTSTNYLGDFSVMPKALMNAKTV